MTTRPLQLEHYSTLGEYIRSYRVLLDLSQKELSEGTGLSGATAISLYENDHSTPNFVTAVKILNFLQAKGAPAIDLQAIAKRQDMLSRPDYEEDADEKEPIEHDDFVPMRE